MRTVQQAKDRALGGGKGLAARVTDAQFLGLAVYTNVAFPTLDFCTTLGIEEKYCPDEKEVPDE